MEPKKTYDFKQLNDILISRIEKLLFEWLPGGKKDGSNFVCGSLQGQAGRSLSVRLSDGVWKDFNTGESGGDLISLYAAIHGLRMSEAYNRLSPYKAAPRLHPSKNRDKIEKPPANATTPDFRHPQNNTKPSLVHAYHDSQGQVIFYATRYDQEDGKIFLPWSWNSTTKQWQNKGFPTPRPLYNAHLLAAHPQKPVLIVEGEKAADAASQFVGKNYIPTTWPNGAQSWKNADWSLLKNRDVLLWPDADKPGIACVVEIADNLNKICKSVKTLQVDINGGWDAADALSEGWTWNDFKTWAKQRVEIYQPKTQEPNEVSVSPNEISVSRENNHYKNLFEIAGIKCHQNGSPIINASNALKVLTHIPEFKNSIYYEEFSRRFMTTLHFPQNKLIEYNGPERTFSLDDDINELLVLFQNYFGFLKMTDRTLIQAVSVFAKRSKINRAKQYLESLTWDGTPRIESFFHQYLNVENTSYSMCASKNWFISMVARIMRPGAKVDNMIVFEGHQGQKKGELLKTIASEQWFESVGHEDFKSKDFLMKLSGKLIVEFGELSSFNKKDTSEIKQLLTQTIDRYRPPYLRDVHEFPRMGVFVGTTNDDKYLRDPTGNRRFWPIYLPGRSINLEPIAQIRDQLFAEALHAYKNNATWWEMPQQITEDEQNKRRQDSAWEEIIESWIELNGKTQVTLKEILQNALEKSPSSISKFDEMRASECLRALGWRNMGKVQINGQRSRIWERMDTVDH